MYLREMGTVALLTREGEVEIAKRIERGQNRVLKALSRFRCDPWNSSPRRDLEKGVRSIKELVTFDEEEITEEIVDKRLKEFLAKIHALEKLYKKVEPLQEKLAAVNLKKRPRDHRRYRFQLRMRLSALRSLCGNLASPTTNASASSTASTARSTACARSTGRFRTWKNGPRPRAAKSKRRI